MTGHELAKRLLELPDLPVALWDWEIYEFYFDPALSVNIIQVTVDYDTMEASAAIGIGYAECR